MPAVAASLEPPAPTASPSAPVPGPAIEPLLPPSEPAAVPPSDPAAISPSKPAAVPSEAPSTPATVSPSAEPGTKDSAVTVEPLADPMSQPGFNPVLGEHLAAPSDSAKSASGAPAGSAAAFGQRSGTFTVTLVTVVLSGAPNNRISDFQFSQAKQSILASNDYWRAASANRLGMQFGPEYRDVVITANSTDQYYDLMAKITAKLQWTATPNDALVVYVPVAQFAGGVLGGGFTDGSNSGRVIMPVPSGFTNNVVTHEFGHVLGLNHANSLECSTGSSDIASPNNTWGDSACDSRDYGDTMDLMGLAQYTTPPINAYLWEYGGFGRGDEILDAGVIEGSKAFTLQPWGGTAARRAVKFVDPASRETYYLSYRNPSGANDAGATDNNRGVMIHKKDARGDWPEAASLALTPSSYRFSGYYNQNHAWQQGSTFRTARGTTVRIDSLGTNATVTINSQSSREAVAKPFIDGAAAAVPALGTPVSDVICGLKDNGCYRGYVNGAVLWSAGSGAAATLNGPLRKAWLDSGAQNGPMGYPVSAQGCGIRDGGCYQSFQGGEILYSAASGAHLSRNGEIRSAYRAAGAESSILGYPTNGEICGIKDGGCYQTFQHGEVLWSPASGARISYNSAIRTAYRAAGAENGILGYPISGEICGIRDGGCYQAYQGGEVLWSAGSGAHLTRQGGIRLAYRAAGAENSILGYPTGAETCGLRNGGCYQAYQRGEILWSPTTSTQITHHGAIRTAYRAAGAESSILGYPTNREICGIKDGGCYQSFQNGEIFWSAASGAHLSRGGGIRLAYRAAGAENGILGYPTNTEICGIRDGGCYQSFQRGEILWSPKTGPVITRNGGIRNTYRTQGAENGALGYPTNTEICGIRDGGCYQSFQNGEILWSPRTEAHSTITGPIRTTYRAQGAENGALGYPTKTQTCTTNTQCTQPFQNGTLTWTPTNGVVSRSK
ncbi:uncharacterized protein with LGFP repeats [Arthrobacter sp. CAN_A6]|uniref:M43 family zinc metalloprotease n=1 Tax=Arthrobacter sp. CAN_A6 TaxID=2787721 RepID=UPI0018C9EB09